MKVITNQKFQGVKKTTVFNFSKNGRGKHFTDVFL